MILLSTRSHWMFYCCCCHGCYTRATEKQQQRFQTEEFSLPRLISRKTEQKTCPIGDALIAARDTCLGHEICEELWNVKSTHIDMSLSGAEIIVNSSGSYMELRKSNVIADLVQSASSKAGGAYLYSNLRGCDGQRVFFNGCSAVALNGEIIARSKQFSLQDVVLYFLPFLFHFQFDNCFTNKSKKNK